MSQPRRGGNKLGELLGRDHDAEDGRTHRRAITCRRNSRSRYGESPAEFQTGLQRSQANAGWPGEKPPPQARGEPALKNRDITIRIIDRLSRHTCMLRVIGTATITKKESRAIKTDQPGNTSRGQVFVGQTHHVPDGLADEAPGDSGTLRIDGNDGNPVHR